MIHFGSVLLVTPTLNRVSKSGLAQWESIGRHRGSYHCLPREDVVDNKWPSSCQVTTTVWAQLKSALVLLKEAGDLLNRTWCPQQSGVHLLMMARFAVAQLYVRICAQVSGLRLRANLPVGKGSVVFMLFFLGFFWLFFFLSTNLEELSRRRSNVINFREGWSCFGCRENKTPKYLPRPGRGNGLFGNHFSTVLHSPHGILGQRNKQLEWMQMVHEFTRTHKKLKKKKKIIIIIIIIKPAWFEQKTRMA